MLDNEVVIQKGTKGPYIQSERLHLYKPYAEQLIKSGHAYIAFDTPNEIERMRIDLRTDLLVPKTKKSRKGTAAAPAPDSSGADAGLLERLKQLRRTMAAAAGVPAYVVFPDRTLIELATHRPASLDQMSAIHGVGQAKLARYGRAFLEAIAAKPT